MTTTADPTPTTIDPDQVYNRATFAEALGALAAQSPLSFRDMARRLDKPVSTINGWCKGRHLPYPRDKEAVTGLFTLLEAGKVDEWMEALDRARQYERRVANEIPYLGLRTYSESDTHLYFGRQSLVDNLQRALDSVIASGSRWPVMLIGPSGTGKSSALRAGLAPVVGSETKVLVVTPGSGAVDAIGRWVDRLTSDSGDGTDTDGIDGSATRTPAVLMVDQFEDALRLDMEATKSYLDAIGRAQDEAGAVIVIGMRADFYHQAVGHEYLRDGLRNAPVIPDPLTLDDLTDAIIKPAEHARLTVDSNLLAQLIADFGDQIDDSPLLLPLLSHVLYRVAEYPTAARALTLDRYNEVGGLQNALSRSAEDLFATLDDVGQAACNQVFARLIDIGPNDEPVRRVQNRADLVANSAAGSGLDEVPDDVIESVIDRFTDARLLTVDQDTVRITHESLLNAWPRLADWIEDARTQLVGLNRLRQVGKAWASTDHDAGSLLRGHQLAAAKAAIEAPGPVDR